MLDARARKPGRKENTMGIIRTTYEIITPESAEEGDAAERGWSDEEGTECTVEEAIHFFALKSVEPSSSEFHTGIWFMDAEGDTNFQTGAETRESYHLDGFTVEEEREIYDAITG